MEIRSPKILLLYRLHEGKDNMKVLYVTKKSEILNAVVKYKIYSCITYK